MRILLTHTPHAFANYYGTAALAALGGSGTILRNTSDQPLGTAALIARAKGCAVMVVDRQTPVDAAVISQLPDLVAVVRCAMDIRNIDVAAASAAGVLVTRASPGFVDSVGELAVGFLVDLARGVSRSVQAYRQGAAPEIRMGVQLRGTTLGIIGYGAIGRRVAELAHALGMKVIVCDPYRDDFAPHATAATFDALLAEAQFVVCLAPANESTANMMNRRAFAAMRAGASFINLARGELVDEAALLEALESGHIAGAAIDVGRAPDQMPSPALAAHVRVIATPHVGGLTPAAVGHQAFDTVRQVEALKHGRLPDGAVNAPQAQRLHRLGIEPPPV